MRPIVWCCLPVQDAEDYPEDIEDKDSDQDHSKGSARRAASQGQSRCKVARGHYEPPSRVLACNNRKIQIGTRIKSNSTSARCIDISASPRIVLGSLRASAHRGATARSGAQRCEPEGRSAKCPCPQGPASA